MKRLKKITVITLMLFGVYYFKDAPYIKPILAKTVHTACEIAGQTKNWINQQSLEALLAELDNQEKELAASISSLKELEELSKSNGYPLESRFVSQHSALIDAREHIVGLQQKLVNKLISEQLAQKEWQLVKLQIEALQKQGKIANEVLSFKKTQVICEPFVDRLCHFLP